MCPESQAVNIRNRSYVIGALVDIPAAGAEGVLFAHGSRFGGHALFVKDNRLHYVYNFVGMHQQLVVGSEDVPTGENLILSAAFEKTGEDPPGVANGVLSLFHGDTKVGEAPHQDPAGEVRDRRRRALHRPRQRLGVNADEYPGERPWHFHGGTIKRVAVDVSGEPYLDLEREAEAMLMRE